MALSKSLSLFTLQAGPECIDQKAVFVIHPKTSKGIIAAKCLKHNAMVGVGIVWGIFIDPYSSADLCWTD